MSPGVILKILPSIFHEQHRIFFVLLWHIQVHHPPEVSWEPNSLNWKLNQADLLGPHWGCSRVFLAVRQLEAVGCVCCTGSCVSTEADPVLALNTVHTAHPTLNTVHYTVVSTIHPIAIHPLLCTFHCFASTCFPLTVMHFPSKQMLLIYWERTDLLRKDIMDIKVLSLHEKLHFFKTFCDVTLI